MKRRQLRMLSSAMTMVAAIVAMFVLHATIGVTHTEALACCQECEGQQYAMEAACAEAEHTGEGDSEWNCDDDAWEAIDYCLSHCMYCYPPPGPSTCFLCYVTYHGTFQNVWMHVWDCWYISCS